MLPACPFLLPRALLKKRIPPDVFTAHPGVIERKEKG